MPGQHNCCVLCKNCSVITLLEFWWEQSKFSIEFDLQKLKSSSWALTHAPLFHTSQGYFNIEMPSYQHGNSHYKDNTVIRQFYLYNGNSYTGKTTSLINSLWPSDAIWRQRSGSTLAQVMACCLMAPSHYLNQRWLIINEVQWHS